MNDYFKLLPDLPILSELPESLQESFAAIRGETIADADVTKAIDRAKRLAWANAKEAADSSPPLPCGGRATNGKKAADVGADPHTRYPVPDLSADPICIVVGSPSSSTPLDQPRSVLGYFSQVGPFSYLVSALIMAFAVIVAWQCKIADRLDRVEVALGNHPGSQPFGAPVGHVSGVSDCQWAKEPLVQTERSTPHNLELPLFGPVPAGRQVGIDSGLLEITYQTGAKVILQGPALFEVASDGGFLRVGRLTGRLETKAKPSNPQSPIPNPFCIRTPTAVVTDLGTEFGVEVEEDGRTTSHVFRGSVAVRPVSVAGGERDLVLGKGESARVAATDNQMPIAKCDDVDSDRFVRQLPAGRASIRVFGTGLGVKDGCDDPRWQVVAASNDPNFQPRAATVTSDVLQTWARNVPGREKWVAPDRNCIQAVPAGTTYTFRTDFDLDGARLETVVLRGRVFAVGKVVALRLNGQEAVEFNCESPVKHSWETGSLSQNLLISRGFAAGTNVMEIEVASGEQLPLPDPFSPLGLRVRLEGSYQDEP